MSPILIARNLLEPEVIPAVTVFKLEAVGRGGEVRRNVSLHTLGKMVPLIYEVRNASAHGQKVNDAHFVVIPHPLGQGVVSLVALAEAATFVIRKTVIEI